jgi:hypothetical protein
MSSFQSSFERWDSFTFWLTFIGTVLLAVGVVTGVMARGYARNLGAEKDKEAAEARLAHDRAIAAASTQIETLRKETAEANARAAQATLELQKLRQKLAPRSFNQQQRDSMIKHLKLVGEWASADICACSGTDEVAGITTQIWRLLADAGWKSNLYPTIRADVIPVGILVESDPSDRGAVTIAEGLAQILRTKGGVLAVHESMTNRAKLDAPIRVTVGTLPI